ncbi:MAG TPA: L-threonylcarbamoyladenylate synthase [Desulfobacteria bacterium]|nr:L-threonylcarbamoyladenylate synthase [Desulfobacteria bacterium]
MDKKSDYIKLDPDRLDYESIGEAGRILREGGLVAFPTETVYGLGANALDASAVAKIFTAKGRPSDNPLIVHISEVSQVYNLADDITIPAQRLMEVFWPGPLTLILPKKPVIPQKVTAGLDNIAVRMPDNKIALEIIRAAGVPVAAPSANSSGRPSPTTAKHVLSDLEGKVDMIIDGGPCRVGLESTVLDLTSEPPTILRPGGISREQLEGVLGHVGVDPAVNHNSENLVPRSPGMKYTHYSPAADVVVVTGSEHFISDKVNQLIKEYRAKGKKVGLLVPEEASGLYQADAVYSVGTRRELDTVARNLFYGLRHLDSLSVDIIIAEGYPSGGMGDAVMNRLVKAAGYNLITGN